ncbi:tellurite resistance TerB family protein [Loktanella sp. M215]|uniref:tellurite resistance TerB family protein n=1 Tax=Loktanella sp. M215 TaxID=2675431 RepID=UPI001F347985|nr:tellurite resistance TerB family protein [Loktanella sp. M215]MCF7699318.1 2-dehydro-3-deoxyphosphooctonate aldolase [Loktanella sp. M215]
MVTDSMTPQDALAALMIAVSASDENIRTSELIKINSAINNLPVFSDYDSDRLPRVTRMVFDLLDQEDGLEALFGLIRDTLPERLFETAYALSCDVAAADGKIGETEGRMLEEIRDELDLDRLHAAAIERGARARHMTI